MKMVNSKRLLAVTADSLYCNPKNITDYQRVVKYFEDPTLQFTTFTITEKGYSLKDSKGQFFGSGSRYKIWTYQSSTYDEYCDILVV